MLTEKARNAAIDQAVANAAETIDEASRAGEDAADISPGDRAWARQELQELRQQRAARQATLSISQA